LEYTKYKRKATDNKEENVDIAVRLLKPYLKKGDLLIIKPNLNSIKIKLFTISSYLTSLFTRGMTHSTMYAGKGNVVDLDLRLGRSLKKMTLKNLLKSKYKRFKGFTVYAVQPKKYTNRQRYNVGKILNQLLKKSREIDFSVSQYLSMLYWAIVRGIKWNNLYKIKAKYDFKKGVCSSLNAYILKMGGVKLGTRPLVFFLPSTFIFSKYFKIKKKLKV